MASRIIVNLILLLVVGVLLLLVIYEPGQEPDPELPRLISLNRDAVNKIRIVREDQADIEIHKIKGHWRLTAPIAMPANTFKIESILNLAANTSFAQFNATEHDLKQFKLDKPRVRLYLDNQVLSFGTTEALKRRRYVQVGDTIHLVTATGYVHLIGDAAALVSTALILPAAKLVAIELPNRRLRLQEGRWVLATPDPDLSADAITRLIEAWRNMRALAVRPFKDKATGEWITIKLEGDNKPLRYLILSTQPDLVLARPDKGLEYQLPGSAVERLLKLTPAQPTIGPTDTFTQPMTAQ